MYGFYCCSKPHSHMSRMLLISESFKEACCSFKVSENLLLQVLSLSQVWSGKWAPSLPQRTLIPHLHSCTRSAWHKQGSRMFFLSDVLDINTNCGKEPCCWVLEYLFSAELLSHSAFWRVPHLANSQNFAVISKCCRTPVQGSLRLTTPDSAAAGSLCVWLWLDGQNMNRVQGSIRYQISCESAEVSWEPGPVEPHRDGWAQQLWSSSVLKWNKLRQRFQFCSVIGDYWSWLECPFEGKNVENIRLITSPSYRVGC